VEAIDWGTAQRIGQLVAGSPPYGGVRAASVQPAAHEFARRVSTYSGLEPHTALPPVEAVDRSTWIAANLRNMRPLLGPLSERMDDHGGPLAGSLRSLSALLLGAQVGALTGVLAQRVLGQYDLALLDPSAPPRLLLLAPNLALTARSLGVDRDEVVAWVTIHEVTHAVQFSSAAWLRGHLEGMVRELIDGLTATLDQSLWRRWRRPPGAGGRSRLPDPNELRELVELARRGELLRLTLGEDRWQVVDRIQATMSLIEGHAEHTMDAVGIELLPSIPRLRAAMTRRRATRSLPWRVFERILGLSLKLRQYELGRKFCDAVVADAGPAALARAWRGPDALPTSAELQAPQAWLARTD
jgi:coenzyme F420 biosynthesis associated uncharacterized protein